MLNLWSSAFHWPRIHADAGTEFADDRLREYASSRGILLTLAAPRFWFATGSGVGNEMGICVLLQLSF